MANLQPDVPQQEKKISPDSVFYQFSEEEKRVIKECNNESFYQRSLPISIVTAVGTFMGVNAGYIKPNLKWGPWPKVIASGMIGYLIGKYSYQNKCIEKLMQLPNSELGQILRERKGKTNTQSYEGSAMSPIITSGTLADQPTFSSDYKSNIDIDMHKPMNSLDTDYRPDYDGLLANRGNEILLPNSNNVPTSYEELRAKNRQEYERTQPNKPIYRQPSSNTQPIWDNQPYPPSDQVRTSQPKESRNQYGDIYN